MLQRTEDPGMKLRWGKKMVKQDIYQQDNFQLFGNKKWEEKFQTKSQGLLELSKVLPKILARWGMLDCRIFNIQFYVWKMHCLHFVFTLLSPRSAMNALDLKFWIEYVKERKQVHTVQWLLSALEGGCLLWLRFCSASVPLSRRRAREGGGYWLFLSLILLQTLVVSILQVKRLRQKETVYCPNKGRSRGCCSIPL